MRMPLWVQQSRWLLEKGRRLLVLGASPYPNPRKECRPPISPSLLPPPVLAGTTGLPLSTVVSPGPRVGFLHALRPDDLFTEIGAPEVNLRVCEALQIGDPGVAPPFRWDHLHVLAWFAERFRPQAYLEIGAPLGPSLAAVALSSPQTTLMALVCERDPPVSQPPIGHLMRELARRGSCQPLTLVQGDSVGTGLSYPSRRNLSSKGSGQPSMQEFDLIYVDGSRDGPGVYRQLKNVLSRCAFGGLVVFRGLAHSKATLPGQYCPRLFGFWERLPLRFPGFRYLKAPPGNEMGLAFRTA
jgi:hypothetical protein